MDAYLTDHVYTPYYCQWMYTEKLLPLEHCKFCYEAPNYTPKVQELPVLHNHKITFGCFNNPSKINDIIIKTWSNILKQLPHSAIVFCWSTINDHSIKNRIINAFSLHGITENQIHFTKDNLTHLQVFEEYNKIDIALDTFPFSGGLTTCEALWMGVPVTTLASKRPSSRQTASILSEIDLDNLICFSEEEYIQTTLTLAQDTSKLQSLRQSLRQKMKNSTLSDGKKFTAAFEKTILSLVNKEEIRKTIDA